MDAKWEAPQFKGLTLLGSWRECDVMTSAEQRGSTVLDESTLCSEFGLQSDAIEEWLSEYWTEHNLHAVMEGEETCANRTLSLVRDHGGVDWDRFTPMPSEMLRHFQVRLFSPNATADPEWLNKLLCMHVRLT